MKNFFKQLLIVLICGTINYLLCYLIQQVFHLPIFFDTVMVMAVLFIYGLIPALGTLIVHYLIAITRDYMIYKTAPYIALYMISGFVIILITWLFSRKKENFHKTVNSTFVYILSAALTSAFASCFIGGIVNTLIIRIITLDENWQGMLLSLGGIKLNLLFSLMIGRIPLTCLDRVITTFIGFGIYYLYRKYSSKTEGNS